MFDRQLLSAAETLLQQCRANHIRLTAAESCTGGMLMALLTAIPGSSDVVERGFVTYSNEAKTEMLGVPAALIAEHGAVSAPVAEAMAHGALQHARADLAVAITGVAGPGGGSVEKPVGTVFIAAVGGSEVTMSQRYQFSGNRDEVRIAAVEEAIFMFLKALK